MKAIRCIFIVIFFALLLTPLLMFNFEEHAISMIDNRVLTSNPFFHTKSADADGGDQAQDGALDEQSTEVRMSIEYTVSEKDAAGRTVRSFPPYRESAAASAGSDLTGDFTTDVENYVNDRIGLRDEMILAYTVINDRLFGKMVHPSYVYGRDGYVFGAGMWVNTPYTEYHEAFADMVLDIQNYCEARGVPFLFVFDPAKPAVLTEYLPRGMNYDRFWVDSFLTALDERGIHYVDTTPVLREKTEAGEVVFNKQYNANHWNYLGAYYGTCAVLEALRERLPDVHVTTPDELEISEVLRTTLPVSKFPINETEPDINIKDMTLVDETDRWSSIYRDRSFAEFGYIVNEKRKSEGAPRALVFQGSYVNGFGERFFSNAFGEYIYVHDYQNVMDIDYYFSAFRPDCVIFEAAEYTFSDSYFDRQKMMEMDLNPAFDDIDPEDIVSSSETVTATSREGLTTILWPCETDRIDYVWINIAGQKFDMYRTENGFEVTVGTELFQAGRSKG